MNHDFYKNSNFNLTNDILGKKSRFYPCHKQKFLFVAIPKNCSTSIRKATSNKAPDYLKKTKKLYDYKKFCIIREPISRFISGYIEADKRRGDTTKKPYCQISDKKERFQQFVNDVSEKIFDIHVAHQSFFIQDFNIDYFVLFNKLNHGINQIQNIYNKKITLSHFWQKNAEQKQHFKQLQKFVHENNTFKKKITDFLEPDIQLYNYVINL